MKDKKYYILSYILVSVLGVLLHFTYDWSGENKFVGLFSATNESMWEHLKLIFFPMLVLTIWDLAKRRGKEEGYLQARVLGILCGMATIVISFYTLWGVLGRLYDWLNISLYFIGVYVAFWKERKLIGTDTGISKINCIATLIFIAGLFFYLSFDAPDVGIFYDLAKHPR